MSSIEKQSLFLACETYLLERTTRLKKSIADLEADLTQETKSSAGDKYETSREMINAEINKHSTQLQQFKLLEEVLHLARKKPISKTVQLGSYVETTAVNYLLAIPVGEIVHASKTIYAIGINSPIAQVLLGKQIGDEF